MEKTYYPKQNDIRQEWHVVDANEQNLGRLAAKIARILLGKHRPDFTPGVDLGDYVVVVNADRIMGTGKNRVDKSYYLHSMYPGGLITISLKDQLVKHPDRVIRAAVWGMLPHNKLGRQLIKKLKVYAGPDHPHAGQNPKPVA